MATLLSFTRARLHDWSNEEKAQFARIQKLLGDAGVAAEIDLGITDEGDPWCAICSGITDDVIIHIARVDGKYLFDSAALPTMIQGRSLDDCAQRFIDDATVLARRPQHGSTVLMHPSAMLAGVILTIFLYLESTGESAAHGKALIELEAELLGESDIIDVVEIEEETSTANTNSEGDGEESPLLVLKQMLQQIAEAVQKQEGDRIGTHGASQGQNWGAALLSSGAVVAAIAYAQDGIASLSDEEDTPVASLAIDAEAEHEATLTDLAEETGTGSEGLEDATAVDATSGPASDRADVVDTLPDDFLLMAQAPTVASGNRADQAEPTIPMEAEAPVEDRFVFADDKPEPVPQETEEAPASLAQEEDVSAVSSLVSLMSSRSIEIKDEFFDLGDFIEVFDAARPDGGADDTVISLPLPLPLPFEPDDVFVFPPVERRLESVSVQDIAERIADFVRVTGVLSYDMTDRSNLSIYDRSVLGHEDSVDIVSRSFVFQDDSVVTFIGYGNELDMVFAA